MTIIYRRME